MKRILLLIALLSAAMMMAAQGAWAEGVTDGVAAAPGAVSPNCGLPRPSCDLEPPECGLPSSVAAVTVRQEYGLPVYEFTVTNNHASPICSMVLGIGPDGRGLNPAYEELYPATFDAPEQWYVGYDDLKGDQLRYRWAVSFIIGSPSDYYIQPGAALGGFRLEMREPLEMMKTIPFVLYYSDGGCVAGTAVEEQ